MERTWLQQYPDGVNADVKSDEATTLLSIYANSCQKYADLPAFTCQNTSITYRELWERSSQFASFLQHELKLKKGQRIAIMLPNLLQYPVVLFGSFQAGLTVVNVNPLYKARALEHQLRDSETDAIVVLENFIGELERAIQKTDVKHVIVASVGDLYSFAKRHVVNFIVRRTIDKTAHSQLTMTSLKKALNIGQQQRYREILIEPSDIAFLQYTGGTTGLAKGAVLSHSNLVSNVHQTYEWLKAIPAIQSDEQFSIITALPLYHIFSLECNCLLFLSMGAENILIPNPRDIPSLVKVLKRTPFHFISGVNTLFNALVHHAEFKKVSFFKLLAVVGGGMAVQQSVADQWEKITGVPICQAYGMTETSCAITINRVGDPFNGSIGLPIPSTFVSVRCEDESIAKTGEHGEICVKGPQVMRGYWKDAKATIAAFTQDGFFKTGDIGYIDPDGFVYLVDRLKDMVLVSGFNVYPVEIEEMISQMPGVKEVAVIGVPHKHSGETVKAFIIPTPGFHLTQESVRAYCKERLTAYKVPKLVEFCQDLPKTAVGKISKKDLRSMGEKKVEKASA